MGAVVVLAFRPTPAGAQDIHRLEARIERLRERAKVIDAKADSAAAAERSRWAGTLDTIRVGAFTLLSPQPLSAEAKRGGELAWAALTAAFGDSVAMIVRGKTYLILSDAVTDSAHSDIRWHADLGEPILVPRVNRVRGFAMNLVSSVYQEVWNRLDPAIRGWLSAPFTPTLEPGKMAGNTYVELVTTASPLARDCFVGNLAACNGALGLDRPADPAMAWYSARERRALVARLSQSLRRGADRSAFEKCINRGADSSCAQLLRDNEQLVPPPLSPGTRGSYLQIALRMGGSGSLSRLLGSRSDSIAARIQETAASDPSTIQSAWRSAVIAVKPTGTQLSSTAAWTSLLWMAGLVSLALRSSRWR